VLRCIPLQRTAGSMRSLTMLNLHQVPFTITFPGGHALTQIKRVSDRKLERCKRTVARGLRPIGHFGSEVEADSA
jgi:hypothetical protein